MSSYPAYISARSPRTARTLAAVGAALLVLACGSPAMAAKGANGGGKSVAVEAVAFVSTDDTEITVTVGTPFDKIASQSCIVDDIEVGCELAALTKKQTTYLAYGFDLAPGEHVFTASFALKNGAAGTDTITFTVEAA